jgi:hypothetical protein
MVEFKRMNGHCLVPQKNSSSLEIWVAKQRARHAKNKMRPERKKILDELDFCWNAEDPLVARSSTTDVRRLVVGSFHALGTRSCFSHHSFFFC